MIGREARLLVCALQFLTRLPTPALATIEPDLIARSARWFPAVGWLVGAISAAVWWAASQAWGAPAAAVLAVAAGALVTGGFHEDGLADTADGLGGGSTRERRLVIMKDSRVGTFGVLALGLVTAVRIAALARLGPGEGALALVVAHGAARALAVGLMAALAYAGEPEVAKLKPAPVGVRPWEAAFALVLGLTPTLLLGLGAIVGSALALAAVASLALTARRWIGGWTGDVLGAAEQLGEASWMLGAAARL